MLKLIKDNFDLILTKVSSKSIKIKSIRFSILFIPSFHDLLFPLHLKNPINITTKKWMVKIIQFELFFLSTHGREVCFSTLYFHQPCYFTLTFTFHKLILIKNDSILYALFLLFPFFLLCEKEK